MLLVSAAIVAQGATVDLYRGALLANPGYWAVEDAYIDKAEPLEDHGGGFTLLGGNNRSILIRFGDLSRFIGPGRRVTSATLVLTPSGGDVPVLKGVTTVDAPWGEGPVPVITRIMAAPAAKAKAAARGAANWTERRAGVAAWPAPGTPGGAPVAATGTLKDRIFEVSGLAESVQGWLDRPWTNHGVALGFEGNVEFFSSQSPSGRPRLVVTTEPVITTLQTKPDLSVATLTKSDGRWTARIRNIGSAPAPAARGTWWIDGKPGTEVAFEALAPGAETAVAYTAGDPSNDPQVPTLAFALSPATGDAKTANDRLDVFASGKPVTLRLKPGLEPQTIIDLWNETLAPQSRFSFAPEGAKVRVRLGSVEIAEDGAGEPIAALRQIGASLGLPEGETQNPKGAQGSEDLYPGIMGYGDTRLESSIPGSLTLPYEPYPDTATESALLEPTGLLSATDVGRLNGPGTSLPLPTATLLRVIDLLGRPLPNLAITVEAPGASPVKVTTSGGGTVLLPSRGADGPFGNLKQSLSNGVLTLRATQNGITETAFVKAWRVSDAFRRSGSPVTVVDVRMNLPLLPLEIGTDLARDRPVTDSVKTDGTKLAAVVDGDDATSIALPTAVGAWIDVDLGRDRTLGEIALRPGEGDFWSRYEIRVYGTGQRPEDALIWAVEKNAGWMRRNRAEEGWLAYRAPLQRVRFVRVISLSGGPATLAGIRIVPVKLQPQP